MLAEATQGRHKGIGSGVKTGTDVEHVELNGLAVRMLHAHHFALPLVA